MEIYRLQEENRKLHSDKADLTERLHTRTHILIDRTDKLKAAENEKSSLLTIIHLLQCEYSSCAIYAGDDGNHWTEKRSRNTRIKV